MKHGRTRSSALVRGPVGRLPELPLRPDVVVTSRAELIAAINASPNTGDPADWAIAIDGSIDLGGTNLPANTATDLSVTINKSCTIYPLAGYGDRVADPYGDGQRYAWKFQRTATLRGFLKIRAAAHVLGLRFMLDPASIPPAPTQTSSTTWDDHGVAAGAAGLLDISGDQSFRVEGCEFVIGSDFRGAPFDISARYPDMRSPANWRFVSNGAGRIEPGSSFTGHGDADWVQYNRYNDMPRALRMASWTGQNGRIANNDFHDVGTAMRLGLRRVGQQTLEVVNNEVSRHYGDAIQLLIEDRGTDPRLTFAGNLLLDGIGNAWDTGNPHCDKLQMYGNGETAGMVPIVGMTFHNNIIADRKTGRHTSQGWFFQTAQSGYGTANREYKQVGLEMLDNIALNVQRGFTIGGLQSGLLSGHVAIAQEIETAQANAHSYPYVVMSRGNSVYLDENAIPDTMTTIENSIFEGMLPGSYQASYRYKESVWNLGKWDMPGRSDFTDAIFAKLNRSLDDVNAIFCAATETVPGATPFVSHGELAAFLTASRPSRFDFGFAERRDVTPGGYAESTMAYIHGVPGTSRTVDAPAAGVEWRKLNARTEAEIASWSSSAGTVESGELVQVREAAPSSELTIGSLDLTIDGRTETFNYITKATTAWPLVRATNVVAAGAFTGLVGVVPAGTAVSVAVEFVYHASGANQYLWRMNKSGGPRIQVYINTAGRLIFYMLNGAPNAFTLNVPPLTDGQRYRILVTADSAIIDDSAFYKLYVNEVKTAPYSPPSRTLNTVQPMNTANRNYLLNNDNGVEPFTSDLAFFAVWDEWIDWSDTSTRTKLFYTPATTDGFDKLTGRLPLILVHGPASEMNALNGMNRGSGGAFDNTGVDLENF